VPDVRALGGANRAANHRTYRSPHRPAHCNRHRSAHRVAHRHPDAVGDGVADKSADTDDSADGSSYSVRRTRSVQQPERALLWSRRSGYHLPQPMQPVRRRQRSYAAADGGAHRPANNGGAHHSANGGAHHSANVHAHRPANTTTGWHIPDRGANGSASETATTAVPVAMRSAGRRMLEWKQLAVLGRILCSDVPAAMWQMHRHCTNTTSNSSRSATTAAAVPVTLRSAAVGVRVHEQLAVRGRYLCIVVHAAVQQVHRDSAHATSNSSQNATTAAAAHTAAVAATVVVANATRVWRRRVLQPGVVAARADQPVVIPPWHVQHGP